MVKFKTFYYLSKLLTCEYKPATYTFIQKLNNSTQCHLTCFFLREKPNNANKPDPNNQTAGGTGTALKS